MLLVDDSRDDRVRFGRALSGAGYEVHTAEDGSQAWSRLEEQSFDVLVSDRQMPGTDGLELVRRVRASREHAGLHVIMLSALDGPVERAAGLAAGAAEYVCKTEASATSALLDSVERLTGAVEGARPERWKFERALVVDGSSVARELLARTLRAHCGEVSTASAVAEVRDRLGDGASSLVVLDATMDGARAWLEEQCAASARPAFVIVTSRPTPEEEARVSELGAIAYLAKPVCARELARVLVIAGANFAPAAPRAQGYALAEAWVADPSSREPQLSYPIVNMSADGALLGTAGPIALGTRLCICLALDGRPIITHARIVRIQEPGWGVSAGCGVVFEYDSEEARSSVARFVAVHADLRSHSRDGALRRANA